MGSRHRICSRRRGGTAIDTVKVALLLTAAGHVTAPYKYPRIVHFVDALPKTVSGKIQRYELRRLTAASHQPSVHKETP